MAAACLSLDIARDSNERRYFTGKPCKSGHVAERRTSNRTCVECAKDIAARGYERKKPKVAEWLKKNKAKQRAAKYRRRAASKKARPKWAKQRYIDLFYKMAVEESIRIGQPVEVDHIVPLIHPLVCGLHCEFNLQLLTKRANRCKGNSLG